LGHALSATSTLPFGNGKLPSAWRSHPLIYGSILLFALILASFPARTLDLWIHIAQGADIVAGKVRPGPEFLFDLFAWAGTTYLGPVLMVGLKAAMVVFMASRLLGAAGNTFPWVSVFAIGLALLAMGNRLILSPMVPSLVIFATLLFRFWSTNGASFPKPLSLLALFCIWPCMDSLFWVGGFAAFLLGVGLLWDPKADRGESNSIWALISGSLLGLGIWRLLEASSGGLSLEAFYRPTLSQEYLIQALYTPSGIAFFPLALLSFLGFLLDLPGWRWSRILPWAGLLVLSLVNSRLIPWFAVVAGPFLAISLANNFSRTVTKGPFQGNPGAATVFYFSTGAFLILFLGLAWPGWLQNPPFGPRSWGYEPNPSWKRAGEVINGWVESGALKAEPTVSVSSKGMARALGWMHPKIRFVVDAALSGEDNRATPGRGFGSQTRSDLILAMDVDRGRWLNAASRMIFAMPDWNLVALEGSFSLFAPKTSVNLPAFSPETLAFQISKGQPTEDNFRDPPAPEAIQDQWWRPFVLSVPSWTPKRDMAEVCMFLAEKERRIAPGLVLKDWVSAQTCATILAGASWVGGSAPFDATLRLQMPGPIRGPETPANAPLKKVEMFVLSLQERFAYAMAKPSPAPTYLAIQALRLESAEHPDDDQTRFLLGEAYLNLGAQTREISWTTRLPGLAQLRRIQAARAYSEATRLNPNHAEAHLRLGMQYREFGYLDLALAEMRQHEQIIALRGVPPGVEPLEYLRQVDANSRQLNSLEEEVNKRRDQWQKDSEGARVYDRVRNAMVLGLAKDALETLLSSDVAAFGVPGLQVEIQLLLFTGAADRVAQWTVPELLNTVEARQHHWTRLQALAALGQYGSARKEAQFLAFPFDTDESKQPPRILAGLVLGQAILNGLDPNWGLGGGLSLAFSSQLAYRKLEGLAEDLRGESDGLALGGLMAVEAGDNGIANSLFRESIQVHSGASDSGWDFSSRTLCEFFLSQLRNSK